MSIPDSRPTNQGPTPILATSAGPDSLGGQGTFAAQTTVAAEGQDSPQAIADTTPVQAPPAGTKNTRPITAESVPKLPASAGPDSLNGQRGSDAHGGITVEGQTSPQARVVSAPTVASPAGANTSRSQEFRDTQKALAAADNLSGGQTSFDPHAVVVAGDQAPVPASERTVPKLAPPVRDQAPPAAKRRSAPTDFAPLADPLLALAADVLDDLEKVRIANENRLRQLTRSAEDSDGEVRGFGLDEAHPDVARLAALVGMLADAEHKAVLNLQHAMRKHPLGPWAKAQKGLGEKQVARLLASIGDPYIRPEITREDGTVEPSRPRMVSELWAYCGYHTIPAGHAELDAQSTGVGGDLNGGDPGQRSRDGHITLARVAPKRQRGQHANWSATAKMRAYLIAESCIKNRESPYRSVYDAARAKYADAVHAAECVRCGPKGKPAQPGSALSDGHKHARALRAVAKAVLKDLWREAKRIHEAPVSGQCRFDTHSRNAADGSDIPVGHAPVDAQPTRVGGEQALQVGAA